MTPARLVDLDAVHLDRGSHSDWESGACVMELAAYIAGEEWSDHPACVSPVLAAFLRAWNDALDDETRQRLTPYAARVIGTAGDGFDGWRAWLATDWLVRECAPAFLDVAGLAGDAAALRALAPLDGANAAQIAQATIDRARTSGDAAAAAARAAAGDAARDAARDAAGAAARDAAGDAARDAAWAAAWAAAAAAARDAAGDAAWAAARDAARAAAAAAARAAAGDAAGAAAGAAARASLAPTVAHLQESAFGLLDRMIESGSA